MNKYEPIPYGYKAYTGKVLNDYAVDTYNRLTLECKAWEDAGREVPAHLLNEKHRHFVISAQVSI